MKIRTFLRAIFFRSRVEEELQKEIAFHFSMEEKANLSQGADPDHAHFAALRSFGGVAQVKEECRDAWGARFIDDVRQDISYGLRGIRRNPGFSFIVVLTLALGIGANTAMFSIVHGVLLRDLPYWRPSRLEIISQSAPQAGQSSIGFSVPDFSDFRERNRAFTALAEYHSMWFILLGKHDPERVQTAVVSDNFFDVLGVKPLLGRGFLPGEDRPGAAPVLVLSYDFWKAHLGGDPNVVGQVFEMNDRQHTIVGVLPPLPSFPGPDQIFMPASACPFRGSASTIGNRQFRIISHVFGRLKDGIVAGQADSDTRRVAVELCTAYPQDYPKTEGYTAGVQSLAHAFTGGARAPLLLLLATSGFVLFIACANVANLSLSRLVRRDRELAMRTALGADRGRIYRQLLTENTLLALCGGVLGLLVARGGLYLLVNYATHFLPRVNEIKINGPVLIFTLVLSLLTGLIFGSRPRVLSGETLLNTLKDGSRGTSQGRIKLRSLLVIGQVAISVPLLVGAGLAARSLYALQNVDPGFETQHVLAARIDLNWTRYNDSAKQLAFWERVLSEIKKLPGVQSAAISAFIPLGGLANSPAPFLPEHHVLATDAAGPKASVMVSSEDYFETVGVPLLRGRKFAENDVATSPPVAVVNQSLASRYWPNEDPVGRRISFDGGKKWTAIVGVVGNARQQLDSAPVDEIFVPLRTAEGFINATILVHTAAIPAALSRELREAIRSVDPQQPIDWVQPVSEFREGSLAPRRLIATLLGLFGLLALIITATGIGGVLAFAVTQRTHEIGIRMSLGANRGNVLWMMLRQGLALVLIGLLGGLATAVLLSQLMNSILYGVPSMDPLTYAGVVFALLTVAAAACWFPARRATSVDPVTALRAD